MNLNASVDGVIGDAYYGNAAAPVVLRAVVNAAGLCLDDHNTARSQNGKGPLTYDSKVSEK